MNWNEFTEAIEDAEITVRKCDIALEKLLILAVGRLRNSKIPSCVLSDLKRELRDFNITNQCWRER